MKIKNFNLSTGSSPQATRIAKELSKADTLASSFSLTFFGNGRSLHDNTLINLLRGLERSRKTLRHLALCNEIVLFSSPALNQLEELLAKSKKIETLELSIKIHDLRLPSNIPTLKTLTLHQQYFLSDYNQRIITALCKFLRNTTDCSLETINLDLKFAKYEAEIRRAIRKNPNITQEITINFSETPEFEYEEKIKAPKPKSYREERKRKRKTTEHTTSSHIPLSAALSLTPLFFPLFRKISSPPPPSLPTNPVRFFSPMVLIPPKPPALPAPAKRKKTLPSSKGKTI